MDRLEFLQLGGIGVGVLAVPILGKPVPLLGAAGPIPTADKKALADVALNTARTKGAKLDLYVDEAESWTAWRQARRERATTLASLRPPGPHVQTPAIAELPVPRLPVFLVLLAGLGLLWLDERR